MNKKTLTGIILAVSIIYLVLETSFFISLMNAIRHDKVHTIDDIELYGRSLSGFGMSLLMFKLMTLGSRKFSFFSKFSAVSVVFFITFYGQKLFVDSYIDSRSEAKQKRHYRAYMIQKSYANNVRTFPNINSQYAGSLSLDVQIAFFTPVAIGQAELFKDRGRLKPEYWSSIYQSDFKNNWYYYYTKYQSVNQHISKLLGKYEQSSNELTERLRFRGIQEHKKVVRNYHRYIRRLGHTGITQKIRNNIYKETGIRMSENWHPTQDKKEFMNKYMFQFKDEIEKEKQNMLHLLYGVNVSLMHIDNPLRSPAIIKKINERVGIFSNSHIFPINLNVNDFYHHYKDTIPENLVTKYESANRDPELLDDIGRVFVVPFIALLLSAIGIVLNFRSFIDTVTLVFVYGDRKTLMYQCTRGVLWALVFVGPFIITHTIFGNSNFLFDQLKYCSTIEVWVTHYGSSVAFIISSIVRNNIFLMF